MSEDTKALRQKLLKFSVFRQKDIEVLLPNDNGELEKTLIRVRQPDIDTRNRIMQAHQAKSDGTGISLGMALAIVHCVRNPVGDALVFEPTDVEALRGFPAGSWVDELAASVLQLLQEGADAAKKA